MIEEIYNVNFKLNGISYTKKELLIFCKKPSKNKAVHDFIIDFLSIKKTIEIKTSGSTGDSKILLMKKSIMINSAKKTGEFFNLKKEQKALLCLPIKFIAGKMMVVRSLALGLDLYLKKSCTNPLEKIDQNYDFTALTALQLSNSIKHTNKVKILIVGGSPLNSRLLKEISLSTSGVYETYGMTETVSHIALKNLSIGEKEFNTLPGVKLLSRNKTLEINAPYISKKPIITNDIVELISETKFVWIGRNDFVINSGGIKINPEIIEEKLYPFYSDNFIICGSPHEKLGEQITLVFENKIPLNYNIHFKNLGKYEVPKEIFCLKHFKYNNGKIARKYIQNLIIKIKSEKSN
tara:strand:+ start:5656 stop:6705 length:1050 start_codon:yes stop_codon:yes gene_type:complete